MRTAAFVLLNVLCLALSIGMAGYHFGRARLLRQLRLAGVLRPPAPPSLEAVPDGPLFVEFMTRHYRAALHRGDEEQLAHVRRLAEHIPPLQARIEALSPEEPRITTYGRGQA